MASSASNSAVGVAQAGGPAISTIQKTDAGMGATAVNVQGIATDTDQCDGANNPKTLAVNQIALLATTALYPAAGSIDCQRKSRIVVKTEYSNPGIQAEFRLVLIDFNGDRWYSPIFTPAPTNDGANTTQAGYYHGEAVSYPVNGAQAFQVQLLKQAGMAGAVSIWACAI